MWLCYEYQLCLSFYDIAIELKLFRQCGILLLILLRCVNEIKYAQNGIKYGRNEIKYGRNINTKYQYKMYKHGKWNKQRNILISIYWRSTRLNEHV